MGPVGKSVVTEAIVGADLVAASGMTGGGVGSLMKGLGAMMLLDAGVQVARGMSKRENSPGMNA